MPFRCMPPPHVLLGKLVSSLPAGLLVSEVEEYPRERHNDQAAGHGAPEEPDGLRRVGKHTVSVPCGHWS